MRLLLVVFVSVGLGCSPAPPEPEALAGASVPIIVEAEAFDRQTETETRRWYVVSADLQPATGLRDVDPPHAELASGGAYLEILPDTRTNHDEELIHGENFSNEPGKLAILEYDLEFAAPGRYFVWVSAYSTGPEDNGIHVGLDDEWPDSGRRMQWCEGKEAWTWASKQRTEEVHCGVPGLIFLDVETAGPHVVRFSMREDGFEFDRFALTKDPDFDPTTL